MPYRVDFKSLCHNCSLGYCFEDLRDRSISGRDTSFRVGQYNAVACTFEDFVPGGDNDPDTTRTFSDYIDQLRYNVNGAGKEVIGQNFQIHSNAFSKVEGDVFELLEAASMWNAAAVWNQYMEKGIWESEAFTKPPDAVPTTSRRIGVIPLPRNYDTTQLFNPNVRNKVLAFQNGIRRQDMELKLSAPDIVGFRLPDPVPPELEPFTQPLPNLSGDRRKFLETMYRKVEMTLNERSFLFAVAIKRSVRSDRLYQPLFEANVLKFIIEQVLQGPSFGFYVHMASFEGADVFERYKAASLGTLLRGGTPSRAIDRTVHSTTPHQAGQAILDELPGFPL